MKCIKMGTVLVSLLLVISFLLFCSKNGDKRSWFELLGKNTIGNLKIMLTVKASEQCI